MTSNQLDSVIELIRLIFTVNELEYIHQHVLPTIEHSSCLCYLDGFEDGKTEAMETVGEWHRPI